MKTPSLKEDYIPQIPALQILINMGCAYFLKEEALKPKAEIMKKVRTKMNNSIPQKKFILIKELVEKKKMGYKIPFVRGRFSYKKAKLGAHLGASSFETPFSDCGRMSNTNIYNFFIYLKTNKTALKAQ